MKRISLLHLRCVASRSWRRQVFPLGSKVDPRISWLRDDRWRANIRRL